MHLHCAPFTMPFSFYILLISNIVLLLLSNTMPVLFSEHQTTLAFFLIASVGIPHGAIDHLLFLKKTDKNKLYFYSFYLTLFTIYALSWIYFPLLSMVAFMFMSAYHFGQSQFEKHTIHPILNKLLGFSWGTAVLSGLVLFNFAEIKGMTSSYDEFNNFHLLFNYSLFYSLGISSLFIFIVLGLFQLKFVHFVKEVIYLCLIGYTFYSQTLILGFALFFIFNHSVTVLRSEYQFLSGLDSNLNISKFIKALAPFTALSVIGVFFLYFLTSFGIINLSLPFIILMIISSLTLPHLVVMELFYSKK